MKVYISGSYNEQKRLRENSHKLFALGHQITSTWLNEVVKPAHLTEEEWHRALALKDLCEVASSDCLIHDLDGNSTSGGRYTELGFSLGRFNMLVIVVGASRYGVFNTLANKQFCNWMDVLMYFENMKEVDGNK